MRATTPAYEHPTTYEIFTRVWLDELSSAAGEPIDLASVPDAELDRLAGMGFDLVYLMGVWTLGDEGRRLSREMSDLREEHDRVLPGWTEDDVVGSPFAVARYAVSPAFGGDVALAALRERLRARGMRLILDFVPNHVARDHHWVKERPGCFMRDAQGALLAGKDPYFPPWKDTAQLDVRLVGTREAIVEALVGVAERCDGVRCDMAMLVLDEVFRKSWASVPPASGTSDASGASEATGELWAEAIEAVRRAHPHFLFIAEAYWDLEWRLQMLGFDYTYDKSFYDRLSHASAGSVRGHLAASPDYQRRSVRFVENHDEPRVAVVLPPDRRRAATVLVATVPGMRFFHHGQLEGRKLRAPLHLARLQAEPVDARCLRFHEALLAALQKPALRSGSFATLVAHGPLAEAFVAHRWDVVRPSEVASGATPFVVVVNFSPARATCRVPLDLAGIGGRKVQIVDVLTGEARVWSGDELLDVNRGLPVEAPAYGVHLFEVRR
ncbi:alpha-amylase family glycosyl hydrolase [Chondromyces apiculatus]|uniref:Alpha-amylase family protein n=1 Tax=Chondromyces apiculatus DSM 436 TaxID=1192034 RepID=A0A017T6Z1_9BACT|nr:alpha-amylase family glycosyl hydrolase [Chondromyces apiculatus]EYF04361.1 Alpha-amylase family protein [Chondromyces apiculatus DSM 436]